MKRGARILIALLLVALLPVCVLIRGGGLPSLYGDTYYAVLARMHQRLESAEGPKLIVVGGSNVAFGLDGALLEQLLHEQGFDYTVCPFGLYAAVGTAAMLDLTRDHLDQGDIVVLAMEPTSETMSGYFGASAFWKCAEDAPELILELDKQRQAAVFGNYVPYLQERLEIRKSGILPEGQGVYRADSFNDRCDMVYPREGNVMALGWDTGTPVDLEQVTVSDAFAKQVEKFCADAENRGASVVLSFSPVNRLALTEDSEASVAAFFDTCNAVFACPVISDPNRYILDSGWFYDNNFHLNRAGAELRTGLLARDLLHYLGCYREVEYPIPELPGSIAPVPENGEDAGFFRYESFGTGWVISGLTEAGLEQSALTVPGTHEGRPVVGFVSDALKYADRLEELRIPQTVESLPDGLFAECENLTRLVLEHTDAVCAVTEQTFAGADRIRIYVPREAYSMYRDGYGCAENPWQMWMDRIEVY